MFQSNGFGQYAEFILQPGKYCKIRILYDPELFDDDSVSIFRKKELSMVIEERGPDVSVLKSPKIGVIGEQNKRNLEDFTYLTHIQFSNIMEEGVIIANQGESDQVVAFRFTDAAIKLIATNFLVIYLFI